LIQLSSRTRNGLNPVVFNHAGHFIARCYKGFMPSSGQISQVVSGFLLSIVLAQAAPQSVTLNSQARGHITQEQLCCITSNAVSPVYPREARLAGIQGQVKLLLVIGTMRSRSCGPSPAIRFS
jgi:hypothetical protein